MRIKETFFKRDKKVWYCSVLQITENNSGETYWVATGPRRKDKKLAEHDADFMHQLTRETTFKRWLDNRELRRCISKIKRVVDDMCGGRIFDLQHDLEQLEKEIENGPL